MDRTGQHRDAVPADLVAEVLTGHADGTRAGRTQDIHIEEVPLLRGKRRASRGHQEIKYICTIHSLCKGQVLPLAIQGTIGECSLPKRFRQNARGVPRCGKRSSTSSRNAL